MSWDNTSTSVVVELKAKIADEPCNIDIHLLHETLLKIPAEKYLELYGLMRMNMNFYSPPIDSKK